MKVYETFDDQRGLGKAIRRLRIYANISQGDLAVKIGCAASFLSEMESGKKRIKAEIINKYAKIFGVDASMITSYAQKLTKNKGLDKVVFENIREILVKVCNEN